MTDEQLQQHILTELLNKGKIDDSEDLVTQLGADRERIKAAALSLNVDEFVILDGIEKRSIELTSEG